ncbi:MAG: hypothetical protein NPIRA03_31640 [Nitrospirales bacterium]|nr:MAG: hypothetical protein NPIRA03_31640 [Nitrospirales bacterium]
MAWAVQGARLHQKTLCGQKWDWSKFKGCVVTGAWLNQQPICGEKWEWDLKSEDPGHHGKNLIGLHGQSRAKNFVENGHFPRMKENARMV